MPAYLMDNPPAAVAAAPSVPTDNGASSISSSGALTPNQVRADAYQAGFRGNALNIAVQLTTPESGRVPSARYNPGPQEDSRGLWQINLAAHPQYASANLADPLTNAKAAYAVSNGGKDFSPWTTFVSGKYASAPTGNGLPSSTPTSTPGAPAASNGAGRAALIAGNFLKEASGAANPWNAGGSSASSNPLLSLGILPTGTASSVTAAQSQLQKLAGKTVLNAHPAVQAQTAKNLGTSNIAGGFLPAGAKYIIGRKDQGRDGQTASGGAIVAPGAGYVVRIGSDPSGFGPSYPIVHFTSGPYAGRTMYIGHTLAAVKSGSFKAGQVLSYTGTHGIGNATVPGWFEIGFADSGTPGPFGQPTPF